MREGGREVRRRIYSVDGILVTLDERVSGPEVLELEQGRAANAPRPDSATVKRTIDDRRARQRLLSRAPRRRTTRADRKRLDLRNWLGH